MLPGSRIGLSVAITALPLPNHASRANGCWLKAIAKTVSTTSMSAATTLNIALPEPLPNYVAERVESGQYGNPSE